MADLNKEKPVMVFVTNSKNKPDFVNYTGDLSANTYEIAGIEYGKHLFKSIQVRGESVEDMLSAAPTGTFYLGTTTGDCYYTNIDYYFDPKSVGGFIINRLEAKIEEISERCISLNDMNQRLFDDHCETDNKYQKSQSRYLREERRNELLRSRFSDLESQLSSKESELEELKEMYKVKKYHTINFVAFLCGIFLAFYLIK